MDATVVDLFCGVGGLSHGFQLAGFDVLVGVDADESCRYAYTANNNARFEHKKVEDLDSEMIKSWYPEEGIKILVGCAPCQPFSTYNQKNPKKNPKWKMLYEFSKLITEVSPDIVSMENVTALRRFDDGAILDDFIETLETAGYHVSTQDVYCPDFGIPQGRTRLVLLASKFGKLQLMEPTHSKSEYVTVKQTIGDLDEIAHGESDENDPIHKSSGLGEINLKRIQASTPGGSWKDWDEELRAACHTKSTGSGYPSVYGRMEWDSVAPTITTQCYNFGSGRFGHPEQDRAISLREAALLQTFPSDYLFVEPGEKIITKTIGRCIGNAVPVRLGEVIAESIKSHINTHKALP